MGGHPGRQLVVARVRHGREPRSAGRVGSKDRDDAVYALNANTGARVWRYQTSTAKLADVGAPPTISPRGRNGFADGVVYVTGKDKAATPSTSPLAR